MRRTENRVHDACKAPRLSADSQEQESLDALVDGSFVGCGA